MNTRNICPVCKSAAFNPYLQLYDDRYGYPIVFTIMVCSECGCGFLWEILSDKAFASLYNRYYPAKLSNIEQPSLSGVLTGIMFSYINRSPELAFYLKKGRTLDVGCAYGNSYHLARIRGANWVGLDADERKCSALTRAGREAYCMSLDRFAEEQGPSFDSILASQVVEHFSDPEQFFFSCARLLKRRGKLVLSCPNFNSRHRTKYGTDWINYHVPYHQVFFTAKGLARIASRHGFDICFYREITPSTWHIYQKLYVRPRRGSVGRWYDQRIENTAIIVDSLVSRVGDLFKGDGDCIVAILNKAG